MLLATPLDVQTQIYIALPLSAISSLRQVCKQLNVVISGDKQLWTLLVDRELLRKNLNLHPQRIDLASASPAQVESWLRCSLCLQTVFSRELKPTVSRIKVDHHVTWLKILRTRWCLLASSSLAESKLTVWCLEETPAMKKEYFLSGPVVEGMVEDNGAQIVVALTVGTTEMHLHIMSVGISDDVPVVRTLAILPKTSRVKLLRDPILICLERDGDDTYPVLINWRENRCIKLSPRWFIEHSDVPWGILHCVVCAATLWLDYIVLIMNKSVEIFRLCDIVPCDENKPTTTTNSIASLPIGVACNGITSPSEPDSVETAMIYDSDGCVSEEGYQLLHFSCRTKTGRFTLFSVVCTGLGDAKFALSEGLLSGDDQRMSPHDTSRSAVGQSSNIEVHLRSRRGYHYPPTLDFVRMIRTRTKGLDRVSYIRAALPNCISDGIALLHYTTSLDFDDGIGLLLVGSSRGFLCVVRFLPTSMITPGSMKDTLPSLGNCDGELSTISVPMNIPKYYKYHSDFLSKAVKDPEVIQEAVRSWPKPNVSADIKPWSFDWDRYEETFEWAAPDNRWPESDPNFGIWHPLSSTARTSLTTVGDVVPLAFRVNPNIVLFRVGPRLYLSSTYLDEDGFAMVSHSALPNLPLDVVLNGRILESYLHSDIWRNMRGKRFAYDGVRKLAGSVKRMQTILNHIELNPESYEAELREIGNDPDAWTTANIRLISDRYLIVSDLDDDSVEA